MAGGNLDDHAYKLHVTAHLLGAAVFLILAFSSLWRIAEPLRSLQTAPLSARLQWCSSANVYICTMSAVLNLFHITSFETQMQELLGKTSAGVVKPIEYLLTCPFMMLTLVVLAGDSVPVSRQMEVAILTSLVLIMGFFASFMTTLSVKLMFFGTGVLFFLVLFNIVEKNVRDHSKGTESLFQRGHGSPYKAICLKVVSTWVLFPIWWLLSAEGLNVVKKPEVNILITAILNIFAKGVYVIFVDRIHDKYVGEESLMDHPKERTHEIQNALCMAARLGPAGAIQGLAKNIEQAEKQMVYIRALVSSEETKEAAAYLAESEDADASPVRRSSFRNSAPPTGKIDGFDDGLLAEPFDRQISNYSTQPPPSARDLKIPTAPNADDVPMALNVVGRQQFSPASPAVVPPITDVAVNLFMKQRNVQSKQADVTEGVALTSMGA